MKVRLGLEDEWDDDYYEDEEHASDPSSDVEWEDSGARTAFESPYGAGGTAVRRVDREPDVERARSGSGLRSIPAGGATVTPVVPQVKMHIVEPKSFTEAQSIADKFKQGTPVIIRLTMTKPDLVRRYIDFASGLVYGLDGGLQKIDEKVFMLTPHNVQVSDADRRRVNDANIFSAE
jgi:cell division inhibitor SepF